jgi:hypothetical protein
MDSSGTDAFWFLTQSPEDGPRGEEHRANVTLPDQQRQQAHGSLCPACQQQKPSPARAACGERRIADDVDRGARLLLDGRERVRAGGESERGKGRRRAASTSGPARRFRGQMAGQAS